MSRFISYVSAKILVPTFQIARHTEMERNREREVDSLCYRHISQDM